MVLISTCGARKLGVQSPTLCLPAMIHRAPSSSEVLRGGGGLNYAWACGRKRKAATPRMHESFFTRWKDTTINLWVLPQEVMPALSKVGAAHVMAMQIDVEIRHGPDLASLAEEVYSESGILAYEGRLSDVLGSTKGVT